MELIIFLILCCVSSVMLTNIEIVHEVPRWKLTILVLLILIAGIVGYSIIIKL